IIKMLKFYADINSYSFVDRIAYAISPVSVEEAVVDALRTLRSLWGSALSVRLEDREVPCCYYEEARGGRCDVGFKAGDYCCVVCPAVPSEDEVRKFLDAVRGDIGVAHKVAALALTWHPKKESAE
ncbi:MAG: hypothetical protein ABWJ97_05565, partial [Thermoproteus sp.]